MRLNEYIDMDLLMKRIEEGYIDVRRHNTLPLQILCYSKAATFDQVWDDATCKCRGLIVEAGTGEIIARPFEKFFNLNHAGRPETATDRLLKETSMPVFSEKLDGSMGTFWKYGAEYGVATKGSFHSEQAEWATNWLKKHWAQRALAPMSAGVGAWPVGFTPVFEIIAQSVQHHVVHYFPHEDNRLVLTALISNETGQEMLPDQLLTWASVNAVDVVDVFYDISLHQAMTEDRERKEGYIVTWYRDGRPPLKVKIKHETFLKLQKIAHNTSPKTIFQALRNNDKLLINEALTYGSPYLQDAVENWLRIFNDEYARISEKARGAVKTSLENNTTRKEHAAYFLGVHPDVSAVCFGILDEKRYQETIWDLVEPIVKTIKYDEVEDLG